MELGGEGNRLTGLREILPAYQNYSHEVVTLAAWAGAQSPYTIEKPVALGFPETLGVY